MKYRELAFHQIDSADLPPALFKAAVKLLLAVEDDGHLKATKQRVCELCSTVAWGTARRLLGDLKEIGILHYSTDGEVYLNFHAWPAEVACSEIDHPGSEIDHPGSEIDHTPAEACSEIDHPGSEIDHADHYPKDMINFRAPMINFRAPMINFRASEAGGKVGRYVGNDSLDPDLRDPDLPTPAGPNGDPQPAGEPDLSALKPDQRWAYELLIDRDVGVLPDMAYRFARWRTAVSVLNHVAAWKLHTDGLGPGVLVWRLQNPAKSRPGAAPAKFLASDLYHRHYPIDQVYAERWDFWKKHRDYADIIYGVTRPNVPPDLDALLDQLPQPVGEVYT